MEFSPDPYILLVTGAGLLIALVAWLPLALRRLPLSLPIVCIALGAAIFSAAQVTLAPLPVNYPKITERFSEFVVIIALMGAGLKLDRIFSFKSWGITWRLIAITMPLSIAAITLIAGWGLGLTWTIALLLAAALAPTDPVLAADVQVGPPKSGEEDDVRFGLTSEAGMNDGFAFRSSTSPSRCRSPRRPGNRGSRNGSATMLSGRSAQASLPATSSGVCSAG